MDGEINGSNLESASQNQVLPVSEAMGMTVGLEDKNCVGAVGFSASGDADGHPNGKRERGRPKKQPMDDVRQEFTSLTGLSSASSQKRGRGRPKGSGKWQTLAATSSGSALDTAGSNFTPHTMTIQTGENVVQRIGAFTQKVAESACILSASGAVSSAELLRPGSFGVLRYEGRYDIVCLSGSYAHNGADGSNGKNCLLSVQLSNQEGGIFGGAVGGSLIAGGPIQLVIATFKQRLREKAKVERPNKVAATAPLQMTKNGQLPAAEAKGLQNVSQAPAQSIDAVEKFIYGHDNHASQPFDWASLHSSVTSSHQVMPNFNTGAH